MVQNVTNKYNIQPKEQYRQVQDQHGEGTNPFIDQLIEIRQVNEGNNTVTMDIIFDNDRLQQALDDGAMQIQGDAENAAALSKGDVIFVPDSDQSQMDVKWRTDRITRLHTTGRLDWFNGHIENGNIKPV